MRNEKLKAKLLLHACCAPCFTSVYEQLKCEFDVTIFWFNPNIYPQPEYGKRLIEVERYAKIVGVQVINIENYKDETYSWNQLVRNYANEPEGGKRCEICIKYRLLNTAKYAKENSFDFFATTLSVSPHKNTERINEIGKETGAKLGIDFLERDFEKNNGYKKSIELCKEFNIYRQNYCGCQFSQNNSK
jgi:predicted adenine nucleotide alpha hydrolase (AANH) superfamily ATPase